MPQHIPLKFDAADVAAALAARDAGWRSWKPNWPR